MKSLFRRNRGTTNTEINLSTPTHFRDVTSREGAESELDVGAAATTEDIVSPIEQHAVRPRRGTIGAKPEKEEKEKEKKDDKKEKKDEKKEKKERKEEKGEKKEDHKDKDVKKDISGEKDTEATEKDEKKDEKKDEEIDKTFDKLDEDSSESEEENVVRSKDDMAIDSGKPSLSLELTSTHLFLSVRFSSSPSPLRYIFIF